MSLYVPLAKTSQLPKRYVLSRGYTSSHPADDMIGVRGQQVLAAQGGRVFASSWEGDPPGASGPWAFGGGNVVILDHYGLGDRRAKTGYAHLQSRAVRSGQWVRRGQVIGYADSTGNSTGDHLHFSVAEAHGNPTFYASYVWYDPQSYMKAHAYMNGSVGHGSRVNSPYCENTFVVNPSVNFRESATTASGLLGTTKVATPVTFVDDVPGQVVFESNVWYRVWHPTYGICYVHSKLGDLT